MTSNDFKVSITWASAPSDAHSSRQNHQSQQERRLDLRPLAAWPDLPGPCPCSPQIPWTRATRAAAGLPSALPGKQERVRTTPAGAENTPVLDEMRSLGV